jgi:anti-sigma factor RsiW
MLITNHPDDERLSALASRDPDGVADPALTEHLATCDRCAALVADLGALRATLADLPDLRPPRPLRLLPEAEPAPDAGGWIRRLFTPVLTAGAALALVGLVGTTAPIFSGAASGAYQDAGNELAGATDDRQEAMESAAPAYAPGGDSEESPAIQSLSSDSASGRTNDTDGSGGADNAADQAPPAERSLWPMVLFTGIALMIGAALLRWILVPRAG